MQAAFAFRQNRAYAKQGDIMKKQVKRVKEPEMKGKRENRFITLLTRLPRFRFKRTVIKKTEFGFRDANDKVI